MTPTLGSRARRAVLVAAMALPALLVAGCFNPFAPRVAPARGVSRTAPIPNTPEGVVRLFAWCWNNRALDEYQEIFTEDFKFQFATTDTAGNAYRDRAANREDEIETARHLFVGGRPGEPPANRIELNLDQNLNAQIDGRPGKQDSTYHREIVSQVVLAIDTDAENFRVTGQARFFVIRGDSAVIPADMLQKGFQPDSKRWYIERWEDETIGSAAQMAAIRAGQGGLRLALPLPSPGAGPQPPRVSGAAVEAGWSRAGAGKTGALSGIPGSPVYVTWGYILRRFDPGH